MKFIVTLILMACPVLGADLVLLNDGMSDYQIIVPDKLPTDSLAESLNQTARLMQGAFKANGADVSVQAESKRDTAKPAIFLGNTQFAQKNGVDVTKLKGWSYVQKVVGPDVIIAGREDAAPGSGKRKSEWERIGTAKGVTDFLRQYMGTRFLYPDLAPRQAINEAAKVDLLNSPAIEFLPTPRISVPGDWDIQKTPVFQSFTAYPPYC